MSSVRDRIRWIDATTFEVGGHAFHLDLSRDRPVSDDRLVVMKDRALVEAYQDVCASVEPKRIVEIGIWGGGGTILLDRLTEPEKLVAFDRADERASYLDRYVASNAAERRISCHYGVYQTQTTRIRAILDAEFGVEPLDLVVDDASHLLDETRTTFNALFPRLRPGGVYAIEDWAWAHWAGHYQEGAWLERAPMSELIFETVLVAASYKEVVASVHVEPGLVAVRRGTASLGQGFEVSKCYRSRGKKLGWV
jgi:predicted O-methyltransferase YrrM